ncbi:putative helicase MOV-10 [Anastrepha ludens]|uniref:putative helicase MOV-10 n=1 Tax=Anastrepha ludens TaxID=28586 RepID=UPI0023B1B9AD|nr:putative helicase MOV-10 [Anastrepha ludens]
MLKNKSKIKEIQDTEEKGKAKPAEDASSVSNAKTFADICWDFKNKLSIKADAEEKPPASPVRTPKYYQDYYIFEQPNFGLFKIVSELGHYYPSNDMKIAQVNKFDCDYLSQGDEMIKAYLDNPVLDANNIYKIFKMLVQIEDLHTMLPYCRVYLENVVVTASDGYLKFNINVPSNVNIDEILNPIMDEVVFVPLMSRAVAQNQINYAVDLLIHHQHETLITDVELFREVGLLDKLEGQIAYVESPSPRFNINKTYDIIFRSRRVHFRYQQRALELLDEVRCEYLFPERNPYKDEAPKKIKLQIINKQIMENPEQLQAVAQVVGGANPFVPYIVVGPPGTGKTTTIVEAILQLYICRPNCRILITASTNSACDTIALKLCEHFEKNPILRKLSLQRSGTNFMGRPKPPTAMLRVFSKSLFKKGVKNINRTLLEHSNFCKRTYNSPSVEVLQKYNIIVVTLCTMGRLRTGTIGNWHFTHVFIDEAGATTETEALIAITSVNTKTCRVILSGDTKQLGPVVMSPVAAELGLKYSLMERLLGRDCYAVKEDGTYDYTLQTRLRRNYRSHPAIVKLYNHLYYDGKLMAKANLDNLIKWQNFSILDNENSPVIFQAVYGKLGKSLTSCSSYNKLEIDVIIWTIKQLRINAMSKCACFGPGDIGIISPYKLQCGHIKKRLQEENIQGVEVGTVEIFQGREKPIIIASFVKSFCNLGFTADPQRLNVVLSRAQSLLILIGNPQTLQQNSDFEYLIEECTRAGNFRQKIMSVSKQPVATDLPSITDGSEK